MKSLQSERLNIDLMTKEDWPLFLYLQTHPRLMTFIRPVLSEPTIREMFELQTAPLASEEQRWFSFILRCKQTGDFIGSIAFKITDMANARAEIGYLADENVQGKGYITEAVKRVIHFLFNELNVKKIVAQCATQNIGSWKVMEKSGMKREGEFQAHQYLNGIWFDAYSYGLINPKFVA